MKQKISQANPFSEPRFAFGFEFIHEGERVLDYGCGEGSFGYFLTQNKDISFVGVDKNPERCDRIFSGIDLREATYPLNFESESFHVVTMFEVLEHINDQKKILGEIHRVLKPGGRLIISVPKKHLFSCFDLANLKFVFPKVHSLYFSVMRSKEEYEMRYVDNKYGLTGDIEIEKAWHQHFSDQEMKALLQASGFSILELDGAGFFSLPLTFINYIIFLKCLFPNAKFPTIPTALRKWDDRSFSSTSLFCLAAKL